jgi:hypothetical protein
MFMECGCHCIVVPVESKSGDRADWIVRMISYCGGESGLEIGQEFRLGDRVNPENIVNSRFLSPEECKPFFDQLHELVHKGHLFNDLKIALRPLVQA